MKGATHFIEVFKYKHGRHVFSTRPFVISHLANRVHANRILKAKVKIIAIWKIKLK